MLFSNLAVSGAKTTTLFLFTGEGSHSDTTDIASLQASPSWAEVETALGRLGAAAPEVGLSAFLREHLGSHDAPLSPLVTTLINLLNAAKWLAEGVAPNHVLGHSVGEVAAACAAGMLSVADALHAAYVLGRVGAELRGAMLHTKISPAALHAWQADDSGLAIAAINGFASLPPEDGSPQLLGVSLCGAADDVAARLASDEFAKKLPPPHPWHHPMYLDVAGVADGSALAPLAVAHHAAGTSDAPPPALFISATRGEVEGELDAAYWRQWLSSPVDFAGALEHFATFCIEDAADLVRTIETGAHTALTTLATQTLYCHGVRNVRSAVSMRRKQEDGFFAAQLAKLQGVATGRAGSSAGMRRAASASAVGASQAEEQTSGRRSESWCVARAALGARAAPPPRVGCASRAGPPASLPHTHSAPAPSLAPSPPPCLPASQPPWPLTPPPPILASRSPSPVGMSSARLPTKKAACAASARCVASRAPSRSSQSSRAPSEPAAPAQAPRSAPPSPPSMAATTRRGARAARRS